MPFRDRADAGRQLALRLEPLAHEHPVVLGLPRGGVAVAAEVARVLRAPLDVIVVRKLGVPYQPELAMGAVGEDGVRVVNDDVRRLAGVSESELEAVEDRERAEVARRALALRAGHPRVPLDGRTVVVVDDGIATGSTARAACQVARAHGALQVVLATPVAPPQTLRSLKDVADRLVWVEAPEPFFAIGEWYDDFSQTTDDEVARLLRQSVVDHSAHEPMPTAAFVPDDPANPALRSVPGPRGSERADVVVDVTGTRLTGTLVVPAGAGAVVLFAHGSGSSRDSPRNLAVAGRLHAGRLATLLFDLLTPGEADDRRKVFDVELLARRLAGATEWVSRRLPSMPSGYFGASTGAAAALRAAAEPGSRVGAVVSRGGRPDLAAPWLASVRAPTLLVVGERDPMVLDLNRKALAVLGSEKELAVVAGASHLFEERGTLDQVASLAERWFRRHLLEP